MSFLCRSNRLIIALQSKARQCLISVQTLNLHTLRSPRTSSGTPIDRKINNRLLEPTSWKSQYLVNTYTTDKKEIIIRSPWQDLPNIPEINLAHYVIQNFSKFSNNVALVSFK